MTRRTAPGRRRQRGITLIEALIAFLVMALGLLSIAGVQSSLRYSSDVAKQRSEAVRLAQEEMARLRAFAVVAAAGGGRPSYEAITTSGEASEVGGVTTNTTYWLSNTVTESAAGFKTIRVTVAWNDRRGTDDEARNQQVTLQSVISAIDPLLSGLLRIAPPGGGLMQPGGRSPLIPLGAHDIGGGRSVFKPRAGGTVAWVFANASGVITWRCSVAASSTNQTLESEDLVDDNCDEVNGLLLAGYVGFTYANPPTAADATRPEGPARNLDMALDLTGTNYPSPAYECFDDAPTDPAVAQRDAAYFCAVYPRTDTGRWSGRLDVAAIGFAVGTADTEFRICRYSADYNADGVIANNEHPASYSSVGTGLVNQNFLVIPGPAACPTDGAVDPSAGNRVNSNTVQHQPVPAS